MFVCVFKKRQALKYQLKNKVFWELIQHSVLEIYDSDDIIAPCFFPVDGGTAVRFSKLRVLIIRPDTSYI
jgi:hypothetical protein